MNLFIIAVAAGLFTLLGGLFAMRFRDKLHVISGFSAGAVVGLAFFDLIPESMELGSKTHDMGFIAALIGLGFGIYMVLDRYVFFHGHGECDHGHHHAAAHTGAGTMSLHSFMDGLGIGLAYQVSMELGLIVALAVLAHDFSDGINTVNVVMKNGGTKQQAMRWLAMDAVAPMFGILLASFIHIEMESLALLLALFAGFFLYIGASDLIPESHHAHPVRWTTVATLLGMAFIYGVIRIAG